MRRILFVDDEPRILKGLERMLRGQRREWDMVFVEGGQAALERLSADPFDVIVSDMKMPGMDGATLLSRVKELHPHMVRIVLSGHTELEAALRVVPVAHQFLTKPCDADTIKNVIERACALRDLLASEAMARLVGEIDSLPAVPRTYHALCAALVKTEVDVDEVTRIVETDPGISAKILQLVNSSFFGLARRMSQVRQAVAYLGVNTIKGLVLSLEIFREFAGAERVKGFSIEQEQGHAAAVANVARRIVEHEGVAQLAEATFTAGMLHDVGKLVLASRKPDVFSQVLAAARDQKREEVDVEQELLGVTHAEMGGYLLGIWGMPSPIAEAVANHHRPDRVESTAVDSVSAVHVADLLVRELEGEETPPISDAVLRLLSDPSRIEEWRELAAARVGAAVAERS